MLHDILLAAFSYLSHFLFFTQPKNCWEVFSWDIYYKSVTNQSKKKNYNFQTGENKRIKLSLQENAKVECRCIKQYSKAQDTDE